MDEVSLYFNCANSSAWVRKRRLCLLHEQSPMKPLLRNGEQLVKRVILSAPLSTVPDRTVVQGEEDPALSLDKNLRADQPPGTGTSV